jgi:hypothetical protein
MSSRSLSSRERQAINDILSEAELEFCSPREPKASPKPVPTIDDECRRVWPDWQPRSSPTRIQSSPHTPNHADSEGPFIGARDVDSLKAEVQRLISRISNAPANQNLSPATQNFLSRVRKVAQVPDDGSEVSNDAIEHPIPEKQTRRSATAVSDSGTKQVEQENRELRKQLAALQKSFAESQNEIVALRKALARSEAIREKMVARKEPISKSIQRPRK